MPLPDYDFLAAPLWLITALHLLTLTLHFVAMNFVVGGVIILLWGKFTDRWNNPVVNRFVGLLPSAMAATITLGVAPLLFLQLVYHREVYAASIVSGWFWILIIPAVIFSYYFLYGAAFSKKRQSRASTYLFLALLGLLYVSLVYSSVFLMAERTAQTHALYAGNQSGLLFNPHVGEYLFRWLHMMLGAVTVGGFFIGWLGRDNDEAFRVGKTFYLWGMASAALFGLIYLISLGDLLVPMMRSSAIWILTLGIVLSASSLHFFFKKRFGVAGIMLFVSVTAMVITRHTVRLLRLADSLEPSAMPVSPQWSIFVVFLLCFVLAVGTVYWMLRMFYRSSAKV